VSTGPKWLFDHKVMGEMFRGRFTEELVDAFEQGQLDFLGEPGQAESAFRATTRRLSNEHARWVVHVEALKGRPVEHVVGYLARYVKRVAIADSRVLAITDATVTIATRKGPLVLHGPEFVRRFLNHVLPRCFGRCATHGLYSPGNAKVRLVAARELLVLAGDGHEQQHSEVADLEQKDEAGQTIKRASWRCHACSSHRTHRVFVLAGGVVRIARAPP